MVITNLPLEVKLKASDVLGCLSNPVNFNVDEFKERLDELIGLYDSTEFKHYRDSVVKLTGADMSIPNELARIPFENLVSLGNGIDYLKHMRLCLEVLPNYNFSKKRTELELVIGRVYTRLELLSMIETDIINPAYQH